MARDNAMKKGGKKGSEKRYAVLLEACRQQLKEQVTLPEFLNENPEAKQYYEDVYDVFYFGSGEFANYEYWKPKSEKGPYHCDKYVKIVIEKMGLKKSFISSYYYDDTGTQKIVGAQKIREWLEGSKSEKIGWKEVSSEDEARAYANKGRATIAAWDNPEAGGIDHVQMVIPSEDADHAFAQYGADSYFGGERMRAENGHPQDVSKTRYFVFDPD